MSNRFQSMDKFKSNNMLHLGKVDKSSYLALRSGIEDLGLPNVHSQCHSALHSYIHEVNTL